MPRTRDWAALALAAAVFWVGLGSYGLVEPSDARYAEIAREMWLSGDWVFPRLLGIHHFHKPPLIYWLSAAGYAVLGPTEWGARACQGILGLVLAATLWRFARRNLGPRCAPWAVVLLATTPAVIGAERMLTTDLLLATCQTVILTSAYEIWRGTGGRGARVALYLGLGLAFLAKGPVGWLVPLLVLVPFLAAGRGVSGRTAPWGLSWGIPLALAVALPWYLYAVIRTPGLLSYFLGGQIGSRLQAGGMGHPHPWHYYLYVAPALGFPWVLLAPAGRGTGEGAPGMGRLLALWALVPPFFFSLPATKLPLYVLPAYPAVALLGARALASEAPGVRSALRVAGGVVLAGGLGAALVGVGVIPLQGGDLSQVARGDLAELFLPLALAAVVGGGLCLAWTRRETPAPGAAALALALVLGLAPAWAFTRGDRLPLKTARVVGRAAGAALDDDDVLTEYRTLSAGLPFYAGRMPVLAGVRRDLRFEDPVTRRRVMDEGAFRKLWAGRRRVLVLTRPRRLKNLPGARPLARGGGYVLVSNR